MRILALSRKVGDERRCAQHQTELSGGKLTLGNIDASKLGTGPAVGAARKTVQV